MEELIEIFGLPQDEMEDLLGEEGMMWLLEGSDE